MNFPGEFHTCRKWGFFGGMQSLIWGFLCMDWVQQPPSVWSSSQGDRDTSPSSSCGDRQGLRRLSTPILLLTWIQLQEWALGSWDHPYGAAPAPARLGCSEPCAQSRADPGMLWATQGRCLCPCARAGASQVPAHFRLEKFPPEWVESLVPPAPVITPCEPAQLFSHVCKEEKAQIWQFSSFIPPK